MFHIVLASTICGHSLCRKRVELPERYCEEHKGHNHKQYNKQVRSSKFNKKYQDFYNSTPWRKARQDKLNKQPWCEVCLAMDIYTQADMVHHKVELKDDWERRLDVDNLESICYPCHNRTEHKHSHGRK